MSGAEQVRAWLYEHQEFGKQVYESRWGADNGGISDDFIGWTETQLVSRHTAQSDALAVMVKAREALGQAENALRNHACHGVDAPCRRSKIECDMDCGFDAGTALDAVLPALASLDAAIERGVG